MKYNVAKEYTDMPGGATKGAYSGKHFRENVLIPKLRECVDNKWTFEITLDGSFGYPPSFLKESFGKLLKNGFCLYDILCTLKIVSNEEPYLIDKIDAFIREGNRIELTVMQKIKYYIMNKWRKK